MANPDTITHVRLVYPSGRVLILTWDAYLVASIEEVEQARPRLLSRAEAEAEMGRARRMRA